ncbi:MAG: hypothetical protein AB7O73_03405 [Bacteroidia bacterium]
MSNTKEDIDLIQLLILMKNRIASFINWIISTTTRKIIFLGIFILIGAGIGYGIFELKDVVYLSELTVSHTRIDNDQCGDIISNLTKLKGKDKQLAKLLRLDIGTSSQIKTIYYEPINTRVSKIYNDSVLVIQPFKIAAEVYNPAIFDTLQWAILNYLETNNYIAKRKEIKRNYLKEFKKKVKQEIMSVDTLKQIVYKSIANKNAGNGIVIDEPIDPVRISQRALELQNMALKIEEQEQLIDSFDLIVGFNGGVSKSANLFTSIIYSSFLAYLIGLIVVYRREAKSK